MLWLVGLIGLILAGGAWRLWRREFTEESQPEVRNPWVQRVPPTHHAEPEGREQGAPEQSAKDYALCLVIPAREFELVNELRNRATTANPGHSPVDQWLAQQLKNTAQWLWYGATATPDFTAVERLTQETQQTSYTFSLDLVVCLFYLRERNPDLEAGTIGRRYDGILALADTVRAIRVSPPVSADALRGLSLTAI